MGQRVKVVAATDEVFDESYLGCEGAIVPMESAIKQTATGGRGKSTVGQSPSDPFYCVQLDDGRVDGFWTEELAAA